MTIKQTIIRILELARALENGSPLNCDPVSDPTQREYAASIRKAAQELLIRESEWT